MRKSFFEEVKEIFKFPKHFDEVDTIRELHNIEKDLKISTRKQYKFRAITFSPIESFANDPRILYALNETYTKTAFKLLTIWISLYFDFLDKKLTEQDWNTVQQKTNTYIHSYESDDDLMCIKAEWNNNLRCFIFYITDYFNARLIQHKNRDIFVLKIRKLYVHEETHSQQSLKSNNLAFKKYKELVANPKLEDIKRYINQKVEADAYGRQLGETLKSKFPNNTGAELVDMLAKTNIRDAEFQNEISILNDATIVEPQIRKKALRAAYDYLLDLEEDFK